MEKLSNRVLKFDRAHMLSWVYIWLTGLKAYIPIIKLVTLELGSSASNIVHVVIHMPITPFYSFFPIYHNCHKNYPFSSCISDTLK